MKMHPISSDERYTVQREFCGHKEARYVARFCGEWIGQSMGYSQSVMLCTTHRMRRNGSPIIAEIKAA